ncbi:substrate-binding domain-containing protein [Nocardiopsis sp. RSe5-2]|uniref:Substrate-binding domain-containing protein n=1 Tax=Nocardiopsis endophytica TaxID=3018445 RepID=A0ABT4UAR6_9ACTN|nr:substrate-binding domain-containing protein [Nocardiopsis endophytica]MDA2814013.1 substrate-binding domain-containing protein [Nocardiopsis endophytica]
MEGARPTLDAVAAAAGVSKATVSKVLNGRPGVGERTRVRVREVVRDLDYAPSTGPRDPDPAPAVHVVFDTMVSLYALQVLDGLLAAGRELDAEVVTSALASAEAAGPVPLGVDLIERLAARRRSGLVVVTSRLAPEEVAACRRRGLGLVVVDPINPLDEDVVSVGATNWAGGVQATEHLLALGHRRIAHAGGPAGSVPARERLHGFREALESAGAPPGPVLAAPADPPAFTVEAGRAMAARMLDSADPPTAVFAASDAVAVGVLQEARARGLSVPGDLSVVGFDDTHGAMWTDPPLTSVRQPLHEMGRVAMRTVLQLSRGQSPDSHHVQLATRLVVRGSTAPPRVTGR